MATLSEVDCCSDYDPLFDESDDGLISEHGDSHDQHDRHDSFSSNIAARGKSSAGETSSTFHSALALPTSVGVKAVQQPAPMRSVENVGTIALPASLTKLAEQTSPSQIHPPISGTSRNQEASRFGLPRSQNPTVNTSLRNTLNAPLALPIPVRRGSHQSAHHPPDAPPPAKRPRVEYRPPTPVDTSSYEGQVLSKLTADPSLITSVRVYIRLLANPVPTSTAVGANSTTSRKTRRVPAGASSWDIPFPFAPGQAPEGYVENWYAKRKAVLLADIQKNVKRIVSKAEAARLAEMDMDALAGWGDDADDQVRSTRVSNAVHRGLHKMLHRQAQFMTIDLERLPIPPDHSGVSTSYASLTESPLGLSVVEDIVRQSINDTRQSSNTACLSALDAVTPATEPMDHTDSSFPSDLPQANTFTNTMDEPFLFSPSFLPTPSLSLSPSIPGLNLSPVPFQPTVPDIMIDPILLEACQDNPVDEITADDPNMPTFDPDTLRIFLAQFGYDDSFTPTAPLDLDPPISSPLPPPSPVTQSQATAQTKGKASTVTRPRHTAGASLPPASSVAPHTPRHHVLVSEVRKRGEEARDRIKRRLDHVEKQLKELAVEERVLVYVVRGLAAKESNHETGCEC